MSYGSPQFYSKNPVVYPKSIIRPADSPGNQLGLSGTSSVTSFCGPWSIESQRMDITYARNLTRYFNGSTSASLSGMSFGENWNNQYTKLDAVFTAEYTKLKSYECFDSSGYSQPQKFEMTTASADSHRMTYGTDAEFTASCLGAAGSINTSQQYYFRRKWNEDTDTEINETCEGVNAISFSGMGHTNTLVTFDVVNWFGVLDRSPHPFARGTAHMPASYGPEAIGTWVTQAPSYTLNGGYSYTQESMAQIINFINQGGAYVRSELLYSNPATIGEDANGNQTYIIKDQGCPSYNPGRHSFIS